MGSLLRGVRAWTEALPVQTALASFELWLLKPLSSGVPRGVSTVPKPGDGIDGATMMMMHRCELHKPVWTPNGTYLVLVPLGELSCDGCWFQHIERRDDWKKVGPRRWQK